MKHTPGECQKLRGTMTKPCNCQQAIDYKEMLEKILNKPYPPDLAGIIEVLEKYEPTEEDDFSSIYLRGTV